MALSEAAKEGVFLRRFLDELGLGGDSPTTLWPPMSLATDNKAARDLAYNPEHHEKTKHIVLSHRHTLAYTYPTLAYTFF